MSISQLNNGDSGLTARTIINNLVDATNTSAVTSSISASLATTASYAVSSSFSNNTISSSYALTASYLNSLNQNLIINGNVTASGDLRLTSPGNSIVRPIINLVLNGTASISPTSKTTNTTSTSNYGINVVSIVTPTSYCCILPQPVKGKTVTFVNIAGAPFYVFPSQTGGSINGNIDGYFQIPNDGKSYSFDCYENPLPGGWSSTVPSPTGTVTLTSDIITSSLGASGTTYDSLAFVSNAVQITSSELGIGGAGVYLGAPTVQFFPTPNTNTYGSSSAYIFPGTGVGNVWKQINSLQFVTNISASVNIGIRMMHNWSTNYYTAGTNTPQPNTYSYNSAGPGFDPGFAAITGSTVEPFWLNNLQSTINLPANTLWYQSLPSYNGNGGSNYTMNYTKVVVPGNFTSASAASPYTSANPGDPGTTTFIVTLNNTNYWQKYIGETYLGTFTNTSDPFTPNLSFDVYYASRIGFGFTGAAGRELSDLKFYSVYNVDLL